MFLVNVKAKHIIHIPFMKTKHHSQTRWESVRNAENVTPSSGFICFHSGLPGNFTEFQLQGGAAYKGTKWRN